MSYNAFLELDQHIIGDIYTSHEVLENLEQLCDQFGSRFAGSGGDHHAAEYIKGKLEEYGLANVKMERVPFTGWSRGQTILEVISPGMKSIRCISLPYSPPCNLEASVIDLGDGALSEFERLRDDIQGKIVLTSTLYRPRNMNRPMHRFEKYKRSVLAGAVGFIYANQLPIYGPETGNIGIGEEAPIPGVAISAEDSGFIRRLARRTGEIRLRMRSDDRTAPAFTWNVTGDLIGSENAEVFIVLGSHYDGHDISQGATDPASGSVVVMEVARLLAKHCVNRLKYSLRFALWGAEELGQLGVKCYLKAHINTLNNIRFYLNLDAVGSYERLDMIINEWKELEEPFRMMLDQVAPDATITQRIDAFSDHFPFFLEGIPTGNIEPYLPARDSRGYGHTFHDTVDKVNLANLRYVSALISRLGLRLANVEEWPFSRRSRKDIEVILSKEEYCYLQNLFR